MLSLNVIQVTFNSTVSLLRAYFKPYTEIVGITVEVYNQ